MFDAVKLMVELNHPIHEQFASHSHRRWRDQWENEDGDIDLVSAGVRVAGWWKKLRKELRVSPSLCGKGKD